MQRMKTNDTWAFNASQGRQRHSEPRCSMDLQVLKNTLRSFDVKGRIVQLMIRSESSSTNRSQFVFAVLGKRYTVSLQNVSAIAPGAP